MAHLSWNEVRDRAIRFSREHAGDRSESAEKQTFWNDFFQVFGLRRASLASFEANVTNIKGNKGAIDLLWRGRLLVEHKSFGEDLALAGTQAFTYIEDLTREQRWEEIPRRRAAARHRPVLWLSLCKWRPFPQTSEISGMICFPDRSQFA